MNIAIIDIGTNTFHLLIAEISDGSYQKIYSTKSSVKLGKGGINKNFILDGPFKKGLETLKKYKALTRKYKVKKIFAFATSAVRSAKNGKLFTAEAKKLTGIDIRVISGEEEAEYIYKGVKQALDIGNEKCLIMDIGGGSIEFIIANNKKFFFKSSYNLGVARILELINPSDPITPEEINQLEHYLEEQLKPLFSVASQHNIKTLIGSSGSFDTFAEMIAHQFYTPAILKKTTSWDFNMEHYLDIHEKLIKSSVAERRKTKGIIPMRVDMIVIASILVKVILSKLNIKQMRLSTYALKEGALQQFIESL